MNKLLVAKLIKSTINRSIYERNLISVLDEMCDIVISDTSSGDEKVAAWSIIIECLSPSLDEKDIDFLMV